MSNSLRKGKGGKKVETEFFSANMIVLTLIFVSFFLTLLDLAGNWWLLVVALGYGMYTDFQIYTLELLLYLFIAFVIGEIWEYGIGFLGIKRKEVPWSVVFLIGVGAVFGAIVGTMFFPILGSVLGGALGACVVAYAYEYKKNRDKEEAKKLALITFKAKFLAIAGKILVGLFIAGTMIYKLRW